MADDGARKLKLFNWLKIALVLVCAVVLIHITHSLTLNRIIQYKEITFTSSNWPTELNGYKIAFITDLHQVSEEDLAGLLDDLNTRDLDLLLLGGDFWMRDGFYRATLKELSQIQTLDGIFGVGSNLDDHAGLFAAMENYGITPSAEGIPVYVSRGIEPYVYLPKIFARPRVFIINIYSERDTEAIGVENSENSDIDFSITKQISENLLPFNFRLLGEIPKDDAILIHSLIITDNDGNLINEFSELMVSAENISNPPAFGWNYGIFTEENLYSLRFEDFNFDGYLDIALQHSFGGSARNHPSYFWLWDNDAGEFVQNSQLEFFSFESEVYTNEYTKRLVTSHRMGSMGYSTYFYKYHNGEFIRDNTSMNQFFFPADTISVTYNGAFSLFDFFNHDVNLNLDLVKEFHRGHLYSLHLDQIDPQAIEGIDPPAGGGLLDATHCQQFNCLK